MQLRFPHTWIPMIALIVLGSFARETTAQDLGNLGKPVTISGGLGGNFSRYDMSGIPARRSPYGYSLYGNVTLNIYGVSLPFSVAISEQGSSFSQPFREYGVSPHYKWAKIHLGHRSMRFSEFTLNGVRFFGAGLELTPGKFRFSAMTGRFREAREEPERLYRIPQYERRGYAFMVGVGEETFVDVSFFKAEDKVGSISQPDSIPFLAKPEANTAVGLKGNIAIVKSKLNLSYDLGASLHTRDLNAMPFEEESGFLGRLQRESHANMSSNVAGAADAGLKYTEGNYNFGVNYRHIQAGFHTLGSNYLLSDVEMVTVSGGGRFFQGKVGVQATYGVQNNNLTERNFATTGRNIGSANVSWQATERLNVNVGYSNFSIYQTLIMDSLFTDSIVIDQTNHQVNAAAIYVLAKQNHTHTFGVNGLYQDLSDRNAESPFNASTQLLNWNLSYGLGFLRHGLNAQFSAGYQEFVSEMLNRTRFSFSVGGSKQLFDKKLTLRARQNFIFSETGSLGKDQIFVTSYGLDYKLAKKHSLGLNGSLTSRHGAAAFRESRVGVTYRMRF